VGVTREGYMAEARERRRKTARREGERGGVIGAEGEREKERDGEIVSSAVGVGDGRRRGEGVVVLLASSINVCLGIVILSMCSCEIMSARAVELVLLRISFLPGSI